MKKITVSFVLLFISFVKLYAQKNMELEVLAPNYENNRPCKTAVVKAYSNGELISEFLSTTKKGVVINLPLGEFYRIEISAPGRVTRFFNVDFSDVSFSTEALEVLNFGAKISLFVEDESVDYSYVLNHPVVTYYYDSENHSIAYEIEEPKLMAEKIEELISKKHAN